MVTLLIYLSLFVTWEKLFVNLGWMLEKLKASLHVHEKADFSLRLINLKNQNSCLGVTAMLSADFEQFREFNLNLQDYKYQSSLCKECHVQEMGWVTGPLYNSLQLMG